MDKPSWWPKNPHDPCSMWKHEDFEEVSNLCWKVFCGWVRKASPFDHVRLILSIREENNGGSDG